MNLSDLEALEQEWDACLPSLRAPSSDGGIEPVDGWHNEHGYQEPEVRLMVYHGAPRLPFPADFYVQRWILPRAAIEMYEVCLLQLLTAQCRPNIQQGLLGVLDCLGAIENNEQFAILLADGFKIHRDFWEFFVKRRGVFYICVMKEDALPPYTPRRSMQEQVDDIGTRLEALNRFLVPRFPRTPLGLRGPLTGPTYLTNFPGYPGQVSPTDPLRGNHINSENQAMPISRAQELLNFAAAVCNPQLSPDRKCFDPLTSQQNPRPGGALSNVPVPPRLTDAGHTNTLESGSEGPGSPSSDSHGRIPDTLRMEDIDEYIKTTCYYADGILKGYIRIKVQGLSKLKDIHERLMEYYKSKNDPSAGGRKLMCLNLFWGPQQKKIWPTFPVDDKLTFMDLADYGADDMAMVIKPIYVVAGSGTEVVYNATGYVEGHVGSSVTR